MHKELIMKDNMLKEIGWGILEWIGKGCIKKDEVLPIEHPKPEKTDGFMEKKSNRIKARQSATDRTKMPNGYKIVTDGSEYSLVYPNGYQSIFEHPNKKECLRQAWSLWDRDHQDPKYWKEVEL